MNTPRPTSGILHEEERQDLRAVLAAAQHALTYPVMFDHNARTVERIQFWLDALRTPAEVARLEAMKARLVEARARG